MTEIGARIKRLRKSKKLTQEQLADMIRISYSTVSLYESGKRTPSVDVLEKLGIALNVDPSFFVTQIEDRGEEDPRITQMAKDMQNLPDEAINLIEKIVEVYRIKKDLKSTKEK